jgi:hypothetical protein
MKVMGKPTLTHLRSLYTNSIQHRTFAVENLLFVVIMLLMFCISAPLFAAIHYVDNGNPSCRDDPSYGSEANPWRTLGYAVTRISAGDTLYIKSGTYTEEFTINGIIGSPTQTTSIAAFPGHSVTIRGNGVNTGRVRISGCHYLRLDGFEVTNLNQGIFIDSESTNITLKNCSVHGVGQEAVHIKENSSYVIVEDCTIYDTRKWDYNGEGVYIGTGSSGPLDNTNHVTVRKCVIHNVTDEAVDIKAGTHNVIVEGSIIYGTGSDLPATAGAIEITETVFPGNYWNADPNHVVKDNIIHGLVAGCAIMADTGCTIFNNVIYDVPGYGIYVRNNDGDSYGRRIYHNTIDLPSSRAVYLHGVSADVRNNIGPMSGSNLPTDDPHFVSREEGREDYRLVAGSSPVDKGEDLSSIVEFDRDGNKRPNGDASDLGAYEYTATSSVPAPPRNLRITP